MRSATLLTASPARLPLAQIRLNDDNPRLLKEERFKQLVLSLEEFPEMLSLRPLVLDEAGVVLGGNMRLRAKSHLLNLPTKKKEHRIGELVAARAQKQGFELVSTEAAAYRNLLLDLYNVDEVPVAHAHGLTEAQKAEFILKDNGSFGEWDWAALANDPGKWGGAEQLHAWGLDLPKDWDHTPEVLDEISLPEGAAPPAFKQMTFTLTPEQAQDVETALSLAKGQEGYDLETGNENKNGNALAYLCQQFNSKYNSDEDDSDRDPI